MKLLKKRLPLLLVLLFTVVACFSALIFLSPTRVSVAQSAIFTADDGVTIEKNVKVSDTFLGGRTGYAFSTPTVNKGFKLKSGIAGNFNVSFIPVSEAAGTADFGELIFKFTDRQARIGFTIKFLNLDSGVVMRLMLSNGSAVKDYPIESSFSNGADQPISFYFNPTTMVISAADGSELADFKSADLLNVFHMTDALESFGIYDVDVSFREIKEGKTAKIVMFDVCGQSLSGETVVDTSAPIIFSTPKLKNGVVGEKYVLPTDVVTYDFFDGVKNTFDGVIKVYNNKNQTVILTNGAFTPEKAGNYSVRYIPVDGNENEGTPAVLNLKVLETAPSVQFVYSYTFANGKVGVGTNVAFPEAYGVSSLTTEKIIVSAEVILNQNGLFTVEDCSNGFNYSFDNAGTYTVRYSATDVNGKTFTGDYEVVVSASVPTFIVNIESKYAQDSVVDLVATTECYMGNSNLTYDVETVYPSGKTQDSKVVTLNEVGEYITKYTAKDSEASFIRNYTVINDNSDLWEETKALSVEANVDAPDYADHPYNGTMLTASRQVEAVYKNTLDLSDNTKDDLLCEFFVAPETAGTIETTRIDLIFTDVHNPENVIDIMFALGVWNPTQSENIWTSVTALTIRDYDEATLEEIYKGDGTVWKKWDRHYYYSYRVCSSLYGKSMANGKDYPAQSVKFYFDYKEGKVYADNANQLGASGSGFKMIADLKDEEHVGFGNVFEGFTTGEVKMSVKISGVSRPAHVMMLNIDGQSTSGKYSTDEVSPSIFVDYDGNDENNLPNGVAGEPYRIFSAYSSDIVDGVKHNVKTTIYKKTSVLEEIEYVGDYFIPTTAGEYVIRYSTTDSAGHVTVKDVNVKVIGVDEYNELRYDFNAANLNNAFVGNDYTIYPGAAYGGTGNISQSLSVYFNGDLVDVDQDGVFKITKKGTYVVEVVLTDYIKQSEPFVLNINADYSENPIIERKAMPKSVIKGEKVTLPEFIVTLYSAEFPNGTPYEVEYLSDDVEITNASFIPTTAGRITVTVKSGNASIEYPIFVNEVSSTRSEYTTKFLYTDADSISTAGTGNRAKLAFAQDCNVYVARQINVNFISFILAGVDESTSNFSKIDCTLADALDPELSVTITLEKTNESNLIYVGNNGVRYLADASFSNPNMPIEVGFSADGYITFSGRKVIKVTKTDIGRTFDGFSDNVYLSFKFKGVTAQSEFGIKEIAGQFFRRTEVQDKWGPSFKLLGDFDETGLGDVVVIPKAVAYDFASGAKGVTVKVESPSGRLLIGTLNGSEVVGESADREYTVNIDEIGDYKVTYMSEDSLGNQSSHEEFISVMDVVPPTITITGKVPTTGKVNSKITLPKMTVTDDNTESEDILRYIYYVAPNGKVVRIKGNSFTPDQKGQYVVLYFAQDADNCTQILRYFIEVK